MMHSTCYNRVRGGWRGNISNALLALLLLLPSALFAAPSVTVVGKVTDSQGRGINGKVVFLLSQPAIDTISHVSITPSPITLCLSAGSVLSCTGGITNITANDIMQPSNVFYVASVYDSYGRLISSNPYYVQSGIGTFDLGQAVPTTITVNNVSYLNPISANLPNTFTATQTFAGIVAKTINTVRMGDQFTSIQAAINDSTGPIDVFVPCGTYTENIIISKSDVYLHAAGRDCTIIQPFNDGNPVITIDATNAGVGGLNHITMSDFTIANRGGFTTADGLVIKGRLDIDQPNDRHIFTNINITGMRDNISIQGRTIWTTFQNIIAENAQRHNVNATTSAVVNYDSFRDSRFALAKQYGILWNNTNVNPSLGIVFDHVNVENNGSVGTLANCAGIYITGVGQASITNSSYLENNCNTNPDGKGADVRLTGSLAQAVTIRDNIMQGSPNSIYNDATLTTGEYTGNYLAPSSVSLHIATTHALSVIKIGTNYDNSTHQFIPDGGGNDHIVLTPNVNSSSTATLAGVFGTAGNGVLIRGGTGSTNDFVVQNIAGTQNWMIISDAGVTTLFSAKVGTNGTAYTQDLNCGGAITPASVGATTCAEQTFTIGACSGLATTDTIYVNQSTANTTLAFPVGDWRVSAAGVIARTYCNPTAGALTPTAQTLKIWARH